MSLDPETLTPAQRAAAMLPGFLRYEAEQKQKKREAADPPPDSMKPDSPPLTCDFCGAAGHEDTPCPVRRESAAKYAKKGAMIYSKPDGVEGQAFDAIAGSCGGYDYALARICKDLKQRQDFGRRVDPATGKQKYPTTLEHSTAPLIARVRHSYEELLDAVNYQTWSILEARKSTVLVVRSMGDRLSTIRTVTMRALLETTETLLALELLEGGVK